MLTEELLQQEREALKRYNEPLAILVDKASDRRSFLEPHRRLERHLYLRPMIMP